LKRLTHGNTRILLIIMPNPKGHFESIKDSRFKAGWQSGPTRTIRVPIALADATLEYARQLDRGIEPRDTSEMFDGGTDAVITEPRDTRVKPDSSTNNKVDTIVAQARDTSEMFDGGTDAVITEPRDTRVKPDSSTNNKVDTIVAQAHDTAKMQAELESIRANYDALLETSTRITTKLREEVRRLRLALELPEASVLLNKLKAKRKKATASLADIEAILEIIEES
jgi:hypothetical protein